MGDFYILDFVLFCKVNMCTFGNIVLSTVVYQGRQGAWWCSRKPEGRTEMDKSGLIPIRKQCHRDGRAKEETNAGRKGLIGARAALSLASLHFLLFNLEWGEKGQLHY